MGAFICFQIKASMRHHSFVCLILIPHISGKQCLVGSLSGADASQRVTEAFKGQLGTDGNRAGRAKA